MRTTLEIPRELLQEAQDLLGFKSKTDVIILSLQELIRRKRIEELKELAGKIKLEFKEVNASNPNKRTTRKAS